MKDITILIGCYYPTSLDKKIREEYINKNVSASNLLYERILFEDFVESANKDKEVHIISAPSLGYFGKQCKKPRINFENTEHVTFCKYSTRQYLYHFSKEREIYKELSKIGSKYDNINIVISEAHLPYLSSVYGFFLNHKKKVKNITLIVPDLPENVKRVRYNFISKILKGFYTKRSNQLMHILPNKYICFTEEIGQLFPNKPVLISHGVIEQAFNELIPCNNSNTFIYSGKLEESNGINILINAFEKLQQIFKNAILIICGDGPLNDFVLQKSISNKNIIFKGFLDQNSNLDTIRSGSVLMCPRIPSEQEKYCFPSKLVNYCKFNAQIVVFQNDIYKKVLKKSVTYCTDVNEESLCKAMLKSLKTSFSKEDRMNFINECKTDKIIHFCDGFNDKK